MRPQLPDASAIAIVDDHEAVRNSAISFLESLGYSAVGFANGEEFLASESPETIACVLLDIRIPGCMNGLSVMRALLKRGSPIRVVILTGRVDHLLAVAAQRLGAVDVIEKPCGPLRLVDSITRAFSQWGTQVYVRPSCRAC